MVKDFLKIIKVKAYKEDKKTYKEDLLDKLGREQLKLMTKRGTDLPVVPLK